jgi:virginiamycin B lyase
MGRVRDSIVAVRKRLPAWLRGREGDAWFMLIVLVIGVVSVVGLQGIANAMSAPPRAAAQTQRPAAQANLPQGAVAAHEKVYHLPGPNPALMNPAIDQQGRVWVGEMGQNKLAVLDPHTGKAQAWTPPGGQFNIMEEVVDQQGAVWFTEEAANYIGRFDPTTQTFKTYPLGNVNGNIAGPEALAMDSQGNLWFTEVTGGALGRLDPATSAVTTFPLPAANGAAPAYPYALAITPDGAVWYGNLSGGQVGRLDPATGNVTTYSVGDPKAQIYSMTIGPDGAVWFTELLSDQFGRIDPQNGQIRMVSAPHTLGDPATLYDVVTRGDALWFTSTGANALMRYTPASGQFQFYQLATPSSVPFGLAVGGDGALWFTADGAPNYIGVVRP